MEVMKVMENRVRAERVISIFNEPSGRPTTAK